MALERCVETGFETVMPLVRSCLIWVSFVEARLERVAFFKTRFLKNAFLLVMVGAILLDGSQAAC